MPSLSHIKRTSKEKLILTQKQENFALNLFKGMTQRESWIQAGYSDRYRVEWIDSHACRLAELGKIKSRLEELRAEVAKSTIMSLQELLETHTEIARGRVGHFLDDKQRIEQGSDLNNAAIQELNTFDITIGKGENAKLATVTKIKLHDPVRSMQEIAKLQGHYPKESMAIQADKAIFFILNGDQSLIDGIGKRLNNVKGDVDVINT